MYYCNFCLMYIHNVQKDGKREIIEYRERTSELDLDKSTPELMTLPTIELFYLLRLSRKIRKKKYDQLHKARVESEGVNESQSVQITMENYQFFTKKMYVLENILNKRLGYIPERIDNVFLKSYLEKVMISKEKKQDMKVY
ncbi:MULTISPECIES: hypothetical protein [Bacillus]|uniref:hypothetical protein n=1 Tax=Bacillus TaxID=1386 RepID=UPI001E4424C7|nr:MULTISPECIES: hypothetical protein [Bacillus]MCC2930288.1 hypothetical protein [Bacillus sp. LBG-1-113]MEC1673554.1 hypothetical protein [Bacillus mojavensis]MEC1679548.1 hypothetical protein [Bacillus mojavensis]MEC1688540.1 hypothetical protein [Bacillus mojavensis]MEC1712453.1 hypothetical protein [Bacillus mojavensis]